MATGDATDILARLRSTLPRGWFGTTPILDAVLTGIATAWSEMYALYQYAALQARIRTATGAWLDIAASDFFGVNLPRLANEYDAQYRARIIAALFVEKGTRNAIYYTLLRLTGRAPVIFEPARPADTGAYIPGQMTSLNQNVPASGYIAFAQAGAASSLTMDVNANTTPDYYANAKLTIVGNTGAGQQRKAVTSRVNLNSYSNVEAANWAWNSATAVDNNATDPYGILNNASTVTATGNAWEIKQVTLLPNTTYTISKWVKAGGSLIGKTSWLWMWFAGTATIVGGGNGLGNSTTWVANGNWVRYSCTITTVLGGTAYMRYDFSMAAGAAGDVSYLFETQLEAGSAPTVNVHTEANAAVGVAVDTPWVTQPDATSVFELNPIYQMSTVSAPMGAAYGAAGRYGSLMMPYQALVQALLPTTAGIPLIAGYGVSMGAYNTPSQIEYASLANAQQNAALAEIFQAVDAVKPAGTIVWVGPSN